MKILQKPLPGTPVGDLAPAIRDLIDNVNQLSTIRGANRVKVDTGHGGVVISYVEPPEVKAKATEEAASGITVELHPVWDSSRQYRLNERVVHKPAGSTYFYVYACADVTAGAADQPDTSPKWIKISVTAGLWSSSSTYELGAQVMWGTPGQYYLYTSNIAGNQNQEPGKTDKWNKGNEVLLGTDQWPLTSGVFVPIREYVVADVRYDTNSHLLTFLHNAHTYDKAGKLTSIAPSSYKTFAQAKAC